MRPLPVTNAAAGAPAFANLTFGIDEVNETDERAGVSGTCRYTAKRRQRQSPETT
jgi:hypothetical protein